MRVHFVGIGGYSMSGLAQVLTAEGHQVTGSDVRESSRTDRLLAKGIPIAFGHRPENLGLAETVVYSTDVPADNPELVEARRRGLTVRHRSEVLADILARGQGIAVTGTHGKTTTTTMIGRILEAAGLDPTVLVGGEVDHFDGNIRLGRSPWVVAEADESDGSFLRYHPRISVATNLEPEHLEHFGGDFDRVRAAYVQFLSQGPADALKVLAGDDLELSRLAAGLSGRIIRYGFQPDLDLVAERIEGQPSGQRARVRLGHEVLGEIRLRIPGRHNLQNALAATAVALELGIPFLTVAATLAEFHNAHRRFEVRYRGEITVVDDYAHHPTEIRAALAAARELRPRRLVAVFQPQRFTRTRNLWEEFRRAFGEADQLILVDIYSPPGEKPIPGISSERLVAELIRTEGQVAVYQPERAGITAYLQEVLRPGDLLITMGAGDIWRVAQDLAELWLAREGDANRQVR